jgi:hypothetical protein
VRRGGADQADDGGGREGEEDRGGVMPREGCTNWPVANVFAVR